MIQRFVGSTVSVSILLTHHSTSAVVGRDGSRSPPHRGRTLVLPLMSVITFVADLADKLRAPSWAVVLRTRFLGRALL